MRSAYFLHGQLVAGAAWSSRRRTPNRDAGVAARASSRAPADSLRRRSPRAARRTARRRRAAARRPRNFSREAFAILAVCECADQTIQRRRRRRAARDRRGSAARRRVESRGNPFPRCDRRSACSYAHVAPLLRMQQFLYFLPLPQGRGRCGRPCCRGCGSARASCSASVPSMAACCCSVDLAGRRRPLP